MRTRWFAGMAAAGVVLLLAGAVQADVPRLIAYQGKLTGATGPVNLLVKFYDAPTGGAVLFTEQHNGVPLTNGVFSTNIGSATSNGVPDSALAAAEVWLGLTVNPPGVELTPRTRLVMVPYAAKATAAEGLVKPGTFEQAVTLDPSGRLIATAGVRVEGNVGTGCVVVRNDGYYTAHLGFGLDSAGADDFVIENAMSGGDIVLNPHGTGHVIVRAALDVAHETTLPVLHITGGSDLAEPAHISDAGLGNDAIQPGMVVSIDPAKPGNLILAIEAYDRKVAGVISGAGGVQPGMIMKQDGHPTADGEYPIAMAGKVYVWAHADANGPIQPGDRLTTSATPGHAMKVTDNGKGIGAVIGKAMTELKEGKGLVLVLVQPQ